METCESKIRDLDKAKLFENISTSYACFSLTETWLTYMTPPNKESNNTLETNLSMLYTDIQAYHVITSLQHLDLRLQFSQAQNHSHSMTIHVLYFEESHVVIMLEPFLTQFI